ncbi:DUF2252 domain-containing protein [Rhizobium lusitanum]|uniref:DUF2252 domain-containing protein n=1 Tax=Rhizobium lusitanum TaxID=293958 RepID=A0A6L9UBY2_9HYPH|nr:DUF2252 family protein [Rhizobium lusitanum]NEI73114.1 DUF2252 domain-containing protein [Rhizobium lusitanum]
MNDEDRLSFLESWRNRKMARSPEAYIRGTTKLFYEWIDRSSVSIPQGPAVWICGDCHLGNLGALADCNGDVSVQIRDFDQTVIGNPAHDLIRLGLSLASLARDSDLPGVTTARMLDALAAGYEAASLTDESNNPHLRQPKDIRKLLKQAVHRRWRGLAKENFQTKRPSLPRDNRFWSLHWAERAAVIAMSKGEELSKILLDFENPTPKRRRVLDAAYWVKGCSSLGHLRCAVLVRDGKRGPVALLDIKEAIAATSPSAHRARMPQDCAERVVTGAKSLSPNLGDRMVASHVLNKAVFVREIAPQDMKIEIDRMSGAEIQAVASYLGGVVGRAHGRQIDLQEWRAWVRELRTARKKKPDAPSWLWSSVIDLLSIHDRAYLEHCRQFALARR